MDILSMLLARNQGGKPLASTETKTISFDGNKEGYEIFDDLGMTFVKISEELLDLNNIVKVETMATIAGEVIKHEAPKENLLVDVDAETGLQTLFSEEEVTLAFVIPEDIEEFTTKGTYILCEERTDGGFICCVSSIVTETIHPIDPKYIPALDSITLNGEEGKRYKVFVNENGQLVTEEVSS